MVRVVANHAEPHGVGDPSHRAEAVAALLVQAEQAHGAYEATELHGIYDDECPEL